MCKVDDCLAKARESIEAIDFSEVVKIFSLDRRRYTMADGSVVACLMHDEDGAEVLMLTAEAESLIPKHSHNEKETYFVLHGDMEIRSEGKVYFLEAGDSSYTLPNVPHTSYSKNGCRMILVRTPSSKEHRNESE